MSKKGKHFCPVCKKNGKVSVMQKKETRHSFLAMVTKEYVCISCGHSVGRMN